MALLEFDATGMLREPLSNINPGEMCIMKHPDGKWMGPYEVIRHGHAVKPGLSSVMMQSPDPAVIFMKMDGATVIGLVLREDRKLDGTVSRVLQYFGVVSTSEVIKVWR